MSAAMYTLRREQWIERPIDEVFAFFAGAQNLEEITPPWVGFKILSMSTDSIEEGTIIRYRLRLHGILVHWRTDICEWNPPYSFVDEQTTGPGNALWDVRRIGAINVSLSSRVQENRKRMTVAVKPLTRIGKASATKLPLGANPKRFRFGR